MPSICYDSPLSHCIYNMTCYQSIIDICCPHAVATPPRTPDVFWALLHHVLPICYRYAIDMLSISWQCLMRSPPSVCYASSLLCTYRHRLEWIIMVLSTCYPYAINAPAIPCRALYQYDADALPHTTHVLIMQYLFYAIIIPSTCCKLHPTYPINALNAQP